jgi:hypothetical protein
MKNRENSTFFSAPLSIMPYRSAPEGIQTPAHCLEGIKGT